MKEYYECNLPETAPYWLNKAVSCDFQNTLNAIHARVKKLNEAHALTGIDGGRFSKQAKILFDNRSNFDEMSAKDIAQFVTLMDDGVPVEPRLEWPNATVVVDTDFVTRHEWESLRRLGIGGSDAAVILGTSPYQTATGLYHAKVGTPAKIASSENNQWVFDRGHNVEDRVIEAFCKTTGAKRVPETRMFASKQHPCCTANIDAIVRFSDGRIFVFEAKTTITENWEAWCAGRIPLHYVPQTRQYPAVLDDDRIQGTYIGCLFTNDTVVSGVYVDSAYNTKDMKVVFVERDAEIEKEQLETEENWFEEYIKTCEVPPLTGKMSNPEHPSASELEVMRKYSIGTAKQGNPAILLDESFKEQALQWLSLKQESKTLSSQLSDLDEAAKRVSAEMIMALGENVEGRIRLDDDSYYEVKNSPRSRMSVNTEELKLLIDAIRPIIPEETARALDGCIVTNPESFRVFSIKKKIAKKKGVTIK